MEDFKESAMLIFLSFAFLFFFFFFFFFSRFFGYNKITLCDRQWNHSFSLCSCYWETGWITSIPLANYHLGFEGKEQYMFELTVLSTVTNLLYCMVFHRIGRSQVLNVKIFVAFLLPNIINVKWKSDDLVFLGGPVSYLNMLLHIQWLQDCEYELE